ncbi:hypothetical protein [Amorphus orientalis]|uniref:Uncharacterized protein n=1 Tax=Amorphus orientalis TaxID=649198 RepID=A0AAE4AR58_9HYPH|nr:hypothetical protein [Amorphus orientalis]MDQ0314846.1 hypothetical protein [Amorphus orientalis]
MPLDAPFQSLRDDIAAEVDAVFAEPVRISFLKRGVVDPDRAMIQIDAPLRVGDVEMGDMSGGRTSDWSTQIAGSTAVLSIAWATYSGPEIRKGDRVKALARAGEPWFEVKAVGDRKASRLIVYLGNA